MVKIDEKKKAIQPTQKVSGGKFGFEVETFIPVPERNYPSPIGGGSVMISLKLEKKDRSLFATIKVPFGAPNAYVPSNDEGDGFCRLTPKLFGHMKGFRKKLRKEGKEDKMLLPP